MMTVVTTETMMKQQVGEKAEFNYAQPYTAKVISEGCPDCQSFNQYRQK